MDKPGAAGRVYIIDSVVDASKDQGIRITDADTGNLVEVDLSWVVEEAVICKYRQRQRFLKQKKESEAKLSTSTTGGCLSRLVASTTQLSLIQ